MSTEVVVVLSGNTQVVTNTRCHNPLCGRRARHIAHMYAHISSHNAQSYSTTNRSTNYPDVAAMINIEAVTNCRRTVASKL
jgi:hypothetical protein